MASDALFVFGIAYPLESVIQNVTNTMTTKQSVLAILSIILLATDSAIEEAQQLVTFVYTYIHCCWIWM